MKLSEWMSLLVCNVRERPLGLLQSPDKEKVKEKKITYIEVR